MSTLSVTAITGVTSLSGGAFDTVGTTANNANTQSIAAFGRANAVGGAVTTANNTAIAAFAEANSAETIAIASFAKANAALANGTVTLAGSLTVTGSYTDSAGEVRTVPEVSRTSATSIQPSYAGKFISITTGGITVSTTAAFNVGESVSIYNNSGSSQTITQGSSVTLRQVGTTNTGNRTLAAYGLCTLLCVGTNTYVITGGGVT